MIFKFKTPFAAGLAAVATMMISASCATADNSDSAKSKSPESAKTKVDYTKMSTPELVEYLIFDAKGFHLDEPVQEGGTVRDRHVQDELQKICTETRNKPSGDQLEKIMTGARASIKYPQDGIKLGDWHKGRELAWSGFGFRVGHDVDDHSKNTVGGNCYNCHQMATDRVGGDIGPVLTGYGKVRNYSEESMKYAYEMIYNAHAYFPCTRMPRIGAKNLLDEKAILDVLAYLFDPESPVNK
jgi:L-cysteine S-thiosulfotransferase